MTKILDSKEFGFTPSTRLELLKENSVAIVIDRKSRIIMKDGKKILEKAEIIKEKMGDCVISVKTSAPVCSKTTKFLTENGIEVLDL
jgi:hypothetical protein